MRYSYLYLFTLIVLGIIAVIVKLSFLPLSDNYDYFRYIETAKFIAGEEVENTYPEYILKPLAPLSLTLFLEVFDDDQTAFMALVVAFYIVLIIVFFRFALVFFEAPFSAFIATLLFVLGYPMLRYGLDLFIETGSLTFYVIGLYFSYQYFKQPTRRFILLNALVATLGFFWKEYSVIHIIIFHLLLYFQPVLSRKEKLYHFFCFNSIFFSIHALWQLYVYFEFHYSYFNWYQAGIAGFGKVYTFFNLSKSLFALLLAAWPLSLIGCLHYKRLSDTQKKFLFLAIPVPFMALLWGWVSSRLFYVIAAPQVLLATYGLNMISKKKSFHVFLIAVIIFLNFLWLFWSYRIQFDNL